jgi:hypothetical protein
LVDRENHFQSTVETMEGREEAVEEEKGVKKTFILILI